jgi:hypothetical protein
MKTPHRQLDAEALGDHIDRLYRAAGCLHSSRKHAPELLALAPSIEQVEVPADKPPV